MKIEKHSANMHTLRVDKYEIDFLIISDIHFDSIGCDRKLLKSHLDEAKEKDAAILIVGDWYDLMQGRYDPRRGNQGRDLRKEYRDTDKEYLDAVQEDSIEFLSPYVDNILMMALGNHETSVMKNCGTNMIERLATILNHKYPNQENPIETTGYEGWLRIQFSKNGCVRKYMIKYRHGDRGNAKRSKGILDVDIDAMKYPDADLIVKGDDHQKWMFPAMIRKMPDANMNLIESKQYQLRLGSYVDGLGDQVGGWAVEKGFAPTDRGGWFVNISFGGHQHANKRTRIIEA
jgi:hypothetical protein